MKAELFDWSDLNRRHLQRELATLREYLNAGRAVAATPIVAAEDTVEATADTALSRLCTTFALTPFERACLLLCAGMELDSAFAADCVAADPLGPTFGLALAVLPGAHWSAITPAAPLRQWRLIELERAATPTRSRLRIDERILHYLLGIGYPDQRLHELIDPLPAPTMPDEHVSPALGLLLEHWHAAIPSAEWPHLYLRAASSRQLHALAAQLAAALGTSVSRLGAAELPADSNELGALARLCEREYLLGGGLLLLDLVDTEAERQHRALRFLARIGVPLLIAGAPGQDAARLGTTRPLIQLDIPPPSHAEQRRLWHASLGVAAKRLNGELDELVMQFGLDAVGIRQIGAHLGRRAGREGVTAAELWQQCRAQSRLGVSRLAEPVDALATWDDLVLPDAQREVLRTISAQMRHRARVYEQWGFKDKDSRGLGISALFTGQSGTGKTMAAEVLANDLDLDLYRIDLSQVVSKYIGETEKNLRDVFDAAERGGAILLFDEADALFGKRSDVKDSHDRYANIEVSYLLQRMESYRGLAILTTNLKENLDPAFLRRLRFIVRFPFPDAAQRAEIWRRIFPRQMPCEGLDAERLAQLNLPGGNIRNIALNAAFLAADAATPVTMQQVLQAARGEYAKLDKTINDSEIRGWM